MARLDVMISRVKKRAHNKPLEMGETVAKIRVGRRRITLSGDEIGALLSEDVIEFLRKWNDREGFKVNRNGEPWSCYAMRVGGELQRREAAEKAS